MVRKELSLLCLRCLLISILLSGAALIMSQKYVLASDPHSFQQAKERDSGHQENSSSSSEPARKEEAKQSADGDDKGRLGFDEPTVTHHSIKIKDRTLNYTAVAGCLPVQDTSGKPEARIFFIAYEREEQENKTIRPITFAFNGGPGASSVYLHLGALGPKRMILKDEGNNPAPPYTLRENEYTWLDFTDLVFIDPVGTGYSRPGSEVDQKKFSDVKEDIRSVAEFIRLYTTKFKRWSSPKFIAGESYGTTRAAGLSGYLQDKLNMNLNGLILISPVLDFSTIMFDEGNDLPYSLFLPAYTATAWYHQKLSPALQSKGLTEILGEVEDWSFREYYPSLVKGSALPDVERRHVIEQLVYYTGLPSTLIDQKNLRLTQGEYSRELMRPEHRTLGILDSRFLAIDPDPTKEYDEFDPALFLVTGPYGAAMNDYVRNELHYETDLTYEVLNQDVNRSWNWRSGISGRQGYLNVVDTLRRAMSKNSHLKTFIASGYYDLATPYFAATYTLNHLGFDPALKKNVTISYYEVGHQMYVHLPSLSKLTGDVAAFIKQFPPE
ncbi:MAG: S10 family peptidase [bacterium]